MITRISSLWLSLSAKANFKSPPTKYIPRDVSEFLMSDQHVWTFPVFGACTLLSAHHPTSTCDDSLLSSPFPPLITSDHLSALRLLMLSNPLFPTRPTISLLSLLPSCSGLDYWSIVLSLTFSITLFKRLISIFSISFDSQLSLIAHIQQISQSYCDLK